MSKLPDITRSRAIPFSNLLIYGTSFLALLGFGVAVSLGEYFTPTHTNAFSHLTQFTSQMLMTVRSPIVVTIDNMIVDRRSLWDLSSELLSILKALDKNGFFKDVAIFKKVWSNIDFKLFSPYLCVPLTLLTVWALTSMDSMKLWSIIPIALSLGLFISTALMRTRDL